MFFRRVDYILCINFGEIGAKFNAIANAIFTSVYGYKGFKEEHEDLMNEKRNNDGQENDEQENDEQKKQQNKIKGASLLALLAPKIQVLYDFSDDQTVFSGIKMNTDFLRTFRISLSA